MSAEDLYSKAKDLYGDGNDIDEDKARRIIEYADDAIREFGNTNQEKKVELRRWKTEAEAVLPPGTLEELRKRAEGELLKRSFPRNKLPRIVLLALVALIVIIVGALALKKEFTTNKSGPTKIYPSPTPEQGGAKLSCKIDKLVLGQIPGTKFAQIFVVLSVLNGGAPSIAENYKISIKGNDIQVKDIGAKVSNTPGGVEYTVTPVDRSSKVIFRRQDSLVERTGVPIQPGAKVEGWLRFEVEMPEATPEFISRPGITYTVSFNDVADRTCSAEYVTPEQAK
ncbi:MAG: hypothetical protein ACJ754_18490 [Pyrinomonadaceae bacterium]